MAIVVTKVQKLHCVPGDHDWEREPKRGKPPTACAQHSAPKPEPGKALRCEAGDHEWRRMGKGKAPKDCPEHKAPVYVPKTVRVPVEAFSEIQSDAQAVKDANKLSVAREVAERLTMRLAELSRKTDRQVIDTSKADYLPTKRK